MRRSSLINGPENPYTIPRAFFGKSKQLQRHDSGTSVVGLYGLQLFMAALCNRADHYIFAVVSFFSMAALRSRCGHYTFALWFLSIFFFFPRVISAVGDWMSTILPHMVWP